MQGYINLLNNQYNELLSQSKSNPAKVKRFARKFPYQIDQAVSDISDTMCGFSVGRSSGTLEAFADLLSQDISSATDKGKALAQAYYELESYFGYLIASQMKGVFIEANLRDYLDYEDKTSGGAQAYMDSNVASMLDKEADYFLLAVEKLVVQSADVRTVMIGDYSMFPQEAVEEVFSRADFIAQPAFSSPSGGPGHPAHR